MGQTQIMDSQGQATPQIASLFSEYLTENQIETSAADF